MAAIRDMLKFRRPGATLFLVIDEVSQYVLVQPGPRGPAARLRDGPRLRRSRRGLAGGARAAEARRGGGRLLPRLGEGPLPARASASTSRRPTSGTSSTSGSCRSGPTPRSRSAPSSRANRPDLKLYAYGCESVTPEEFVEVYPMLPGQVDLILQITTALRTRSARAQGDDQAIRGLLQLLGELFRDQRLADQPVGALVTLDQIYEVQHTALDADVQASMARVLSQCTADTDRARWCGRPRRWRCSSSSRRPRPPTRGSWRSASTTGSTAATRWPP